MSAHYTAHSFTIQDTDDASAVILASLTSVGSPLDSQVQKTATGGSSYPENISVTELKQRFTLTTEDVVKCITAFGLFGRKITAADPKIGVGMNMRRIEVGAQATGSVHRQLSFPLSYARNTRLSVSHRQDASIDAEIHSIYDGTNAPVVIDDVFPLPTLPASPARYTLGALTVNDVVIGCKTQVDFDFGSSVDSFGCDSQHYDTNLNVDQIAPMVTITSLDPKNFAAAAATLTGMVGTHSTCNAILRKRTPSKGTYIADATAEHISITFSGVILPTDAFSASGNQKGQSQFKIETAFDGTNAPFIFDTAYAIA